MKLIIENSVQQAIEQFYYIAMRLHPTLGELTVRRKKRRLYASLRELAKHPTYYPSAQYRKEWVENNYHVFLCEDFHFAFRICYDPDTRQRFVWVLDAVHSLNYHD